MRFSPPQNKNPEGYQALWVFDLIIKFVSGIGFGFETTLWSNSDSSSKFLIDMY
jgi:hypothetical protein